MKKYDVTLWFTKTPTIAVNEKNPELTSWEIRVDAESEKMAIWTAKAIEPSDRSVWDSEAVEVI